MSYKPDETDRFPGLDQIIWRYMDLGKFLDLIDGRLFFPSIQTLAASDKFEGSFPKASKEGLQNALIERAGLGGRGSINRRSPGDGRVARSHAPICICKLLAHQRG